MHMHALAIVAAGLFFRPFRHSLRVLRLDREASTSTVAVTERGLGNGIVRNCGGRASTRMS
jgi:hypothetical protein